MNRTILEFIMGGAIIVLLFKWAKSVSSYKKAMQQKRKIFEENEEESRPPSADEIGSLSFTFITKPDPTIAKSQILPPPPATTK